MKTVSLVGSTAGGLGSALLADVAFLARRAGMRFAQNVSVEAYLALDAVFAGRYFQAVDAMRSSCAKS